MIGQRRLRPLRCHRQAGLFGHRNGAAAIGHPEGGQANGDARGRRSRLAAAQMRILHEGHRTHVFVFVTGENHSVPGDALPEGAEQGDDQ